MSFHNKKLETEGNFFKIIKARYEKPTAIIFSSEIPKAFPLRSINLRTINILTVFSLLTHEHALSHFVAAGMNCVTSLGED